MVFNISGVQDLSWTKKRSQKWKKCLEENKVNQTNILQLFKNAFMKASLDEDEDIRVTSGLGSVFLIEVLSDKKMLKYVSMFGFKTSASASQKLL